MAMSLPMPKNEQAMGMSSREPPATPDAPQAPRVAMMPRNRAEMKLTSTPMVWVTAKVMTVMVTAAPLMLMVAPSGMLTE